MREVSLVQMVNSGPLDHKVLRDDPGQEETLDNKVRKETVETQGHLDKQVILIIMLKTIDFKRE